MPEETKAAGRQLVLRHCGVDIDYVYNKQRLSDLVRQAMALDMALDSQGLPDYRQQPLIRDSIARQSAAQQ